LSLLETTDFTIKISEHANMEFIKFLIDESPQEAIYIFAVSILYGLIAGLFAPLVMEAASEIIAGKLYMTWVFVLVGCVVVQIVTFGIAEFRTANLMEHALEKLVLRIADNLRRDELPDFEQRNHSDIRLSVGEARDISEGAIQSIRVLQSMISVSVIWFYIFTISAMAGIIFLVVYGMMLLLHELIRKLGKDQFFQISETESSLFDLFNHFLSGFKEIRTDYRKNNDLFTNYLKPVIRKIKQLRYQMSFINGDFGVCLAVSIFSLMAINVFCLPSHGFSETTMLLVVCTMYAVKPSVTALTSLPGIAMGQSALLRLQKFARENIYTSSKENLYNPARELPDSFDTIVLHDICFSYSEPDGTPGFSVGPVKLTLRAGEILFIAGGNGSGKSTLVKILMGLYPPTSGTVTINGSQVNLPEHRYLFSAIFSDFHLFDALYGIETPDENQIRELLEQMQLHRKTSFFDGRFTTSDLSAGQRRRLALVAALPEDKKIYVFDEWAADQDPRFRRYFYEELLPSLKEQGKTVIVVTHDDKYYHLSDRVITMKDGNIIDEGQHGPEDYTNDQKTMQHPELTPSFFDHQPASVERTKYKKDEFLSDKADDTDSDKKDLGYDSRTVLTFQQFKPFLRRLGWITILNGIYPILMIQTIFTSASADQANSEISLIFIFILLLLLFIDSRKRSICLTVCTVFPMQMRTV